jgi:hypothetical protein
MGGLYRAATDHCRATPQARLKLLPPWDVAEPIRERVDPLTAGRPKSLAAPHTIPTHRAHCTASEEVRRDASRPGEWN